MLLNNGPRKGEFEHGLYWISSFFGISDISFDGIT